MKANILYKWNPILHVYWFFHDKMQSKTMFVFFEAADGLSLEQVSNVSKLSWFHINMNCISDFDLKN